MVIFVPFAGTAVGERRRKCPKPYDLYMASVHGLDLQYSVFSLVFLWCTFNRTVGNKNKNWASRYEAIFVLPRGDFDSGFLICNMVDSGAFSIAVCTLQPKAARPYILS